MRTDAPTASTPTLLSRRRARPRRSAKPRLVLIGNGMAGMRAIEELLTLAPDLYDITVIGEEPYGNYNRILLSPVLAAEKTVDDIMLNRVEWYAEHGITLHAGDAADGFVDTDPFAFLPAAES